VAAQREVAEVQGMMAIAKRFPRNQQKAFDRIMTACQRPSLAESAVYSYARGGSDITGASIRLAEAIAQNWGNIQFGIRQLEQRDTESTVESFAWDLETNTRKSITFQVRHFRSTKQGGYNLTDPRDIYEMVANQAARRVRACILAVVPGDIVDAALAQCEATLRAKADISPEAIKKMLDKFAEIGVSQKMIEGRIQRNLEAITAAQIISLRKIYNSIRDGMSKAGDWFEKTPQVTEAQEAKPEKTRKPGRPKKQEAPQEASPTQPEESTGPQEERPAEPATGGQKMIDPGHLAKIRELARKKEIPEPYICEDQAVENLESLTYEQGILVMDWIHQLKV
ncbi:MAG: hypothetical protein WC443_13590, partial [Desulfobaccales bacterium]